ncbi:MULTISPECIES: TetR/AcrR family transcriptional regulator [Mycobacteriaceae]|uniref:TetR/AcrR family transcriptional regulator n=1 Tax=Mycolicibacterium mucogenicum DSM 44124 TaxID=1226753 RepID=A0A8H2JAC1_MYCMU|nr:MULTISPECIES: TetR/AcrR family transcriptional regulator [Mycobacteriaceae]KAB7761459.1 transcriptional regulator [Mycolicibacterium mucogenicum DSM 44124]QPG70286.1 TetR/AcrR family transcriptional regulator [Mycolicibacterium mucogenicum DSM 44124]
MSRQDWVLGADRNTEALDRILSAASELVSRNGFEAFTIDALAAKLHCSPATIYRRAGGKAAILERLIALFADRIVSSIRQAIAGMEGTERTVTAIAVALECMRAEPLGKLIMGDIRPDHDAGAVTASPLVAKLAEEMIGRHDPLAAQWLIRITFALWYWPLKDKQTEYELVKRFAGPSLTLGLGESPTPGATQIS